MARAVSAATDEQVEIDVDLDAEVPCISAGTAPCCLEVAGFVVKVRHRRCAATPHSRTICGPCLQELRKYLRRGMLTCAACKELALPEDLMAHPL